TIAGPPADKKTVTHAIGPFCYLSIRFGQVSLLPVTIQGEGGGSRMRGGTGVGVFMFDVALPLTLTLSPYSDGERG
ncbi:hypothetical protein NKI80_07005, partial [Mesorhizobium sp. M0387]|uniref:hypothetical protein n=1 Tax=Mesorhizobium sp. M0387 TaxID=2956940 RepID=UPI003339736F